MKKLGIRLGILTGLVLALIWGGHERPTIASLDCAMNVYNKWNNCDNAYSTTRNNFQSMGTYCATNTASNCSVTAATYCTNIANTTCSSSSNPQQCFATAYNSCYLSQYQSCYTGNMIECQNNVTSSYNNRGSSYSSCLGMEGNFGNCVQTVDFCPNAQSRANECLALYQGLDDYDAYSTCLANSGINQCQ